MTRFHELDAWRGIVVASMITYHFFFDLDFLGIAPRDMYAGGWLVFQRFIASSFLLLVGISLTISFSNVQKKPLKEILKKFGKRAAFIMGAALLVTIGTWLFVPEQYVRFGILHLISISIIMAVPFLFVRPYWISGLVGAGILFFGAFAKTVSVSHPFLLWFGFTYQGFATVDYFPVLPWFGVVMLGIFLGRWLYPKGQRRHMFLGIKKPVPLLIFLSRKALWIYLIHQPVLVGLLLVLMKIL